MKSRLSKLVFALCGSCLSASFNCQVASAQLTNWTIKDVQLAGSTTLTGTANRLEYGYGEGYKELTQITTGPSTRSVDLWVHREPDSEEPERGGEDSETLSVTTAGAKFLIRVQGPAGCAGQKHTLAFLVSATSSAGAITGGEDTYTALGYNPETGQEFGFQEASPASSTAATAAAGIGGASSSSSASQSFPPAGSDIKPWKLVKALIRREVTFDANEQADLEIPFALSISGEMNTPSVYDSAANHGSPFRPAGVEPSGDALVHFSPDTRGVRLTRPGAVGETYNASTNTTTGDSRFSYFTVTDGDGSGVLRFHHLNPQTFNASHSGAWSGLPTRLHEGNYVWSPSSEDDDPWTHRQIMEDGSPEIDEGVWTGTPTGTRQKIITYTYTDPNDGAVARAKYVLTLHDEWDNWRADAAKGQDGRELMTLQFPPGPAMGNTWSECLPTETQPGQATFNNVINTEVGGSASVTGGFTAEIAKNLGFNVGFEVGRSWSKSYGQEFAATAVVNPGKHRYAYVKLNWYRWHFLVDKWDTAGQVRNDAHVAGSWPQVFDDLTAVSPTFGWSPEYHYLDFNGDGQPDS